MVLPPSVVDPRMVKFMESESQKQRFQQLVHTLTDECWDTCIRKQHLYQLIVCSLLSGIMKYMIY